MSGSDREGCTTARIVLRTSVSDTHLAELASAGVSYVVMPGEEIDLSAMLTQLHDRLHIQTLLLEGGAKDNHMALVGSRGIPLQAHGAIDRDRILLRRDSSEVPRVEAEATMAPHRSTHVPSRNLPSSSFPLTRHRYRTRYES